MNENTRVTPSKHVGPTLGVPYLAFGFFLVLLAYFGSASRGAAYATGVAFGTLLIPAIVAALVLWRRKSPYSASRAFFWATLVWLCLTHLSAPR